MSVADAASIAAYRQAYLDALRRTTRNPDDPDAWAALCERRAEYLARLARARVTYAITGERADDHAENMPENATEAPADAAGVTR